MDSMLESVIQLHYLKRMERDVVTSKQLDFIAEFNDQRQKIYEASVSSIYEDAYQNTLKELEIPLQYEFEIMEENKYGKKTNI